MVLEKLTWNTRFYEPLCEGLEPPAPLYCWKIKQKCGYCEKFKELKVSVFGFYLTYAGKNWTGMEQRTQKTVEKEEKR